LPFAIIAPTDDRPIIFDGEAVKNAGGNGHEIAKSIRWHDLVTPARRGLITFQNKAIKAASANTNKRSESGRNIRFAKIVVAKCDE